MSTLFSGGCAHRRLECLLHSNTVNLWGGSLTFPALCGGEFENAHPKTVYPNKRGPSLQIPISQTVCVNQSATWLPKTSAWFELKTFDVAKQPVVSMTFRFDYTVY